jgi:hypothetical protein
MSEIGNDDVDMTMGANLSFDVRQNLFFFEVDDDAEEAALPRLLREDSRYIERHDGGGGVNPLRIYVRAAVMDELELMADGVVTFISHKPEGSSYSEYAAGLVLQAAGGGGEAQADGGRRRATEVSMVGGAPSLPTAAWADEAERGSPIQLVAQCARNRQSAMLTGLPTLGGGTGLALAAWDVWRTLRSSGIVAHLVAGTPEAAQALLLQRSAADEAVVLNDETALALRDATGHYCPVPLMKFLGLSTAHIYAWTKMRQPHELARLEAMRLQGAARVSMAARARAEQTRQASDAASYTLPPLAGLNDEVAPQCFQQLQRGIFIDNPATLQRWNNTRVLVVFAAELVPAWVLRLIQDAPDQASPTGPQQNIMLEKMTLVLVGDYACRPAMTDDFFDIKLEAGLGKCAREQLAREMDKEPDEVPREALLARVEQLRVVPCLLPVFQTRVFKTLIGPNVFAIAPPPPTALGAGLEGHWRGLVEYLWRGRHDTEAPPPTAMQLAALESIVHPTVDAAVAALNAGGRLTLPVHVLPSPPNADKYNATVLESMVAASTERSIVSFKYRILRGVVINLRNGTQSEAQAVRSSSEAHRALLRFLDDQWLTARNDVPLCQGARVALTQQTGHMPVGAVGTVQVADDGGESVRVFFDGESIPTDVPWLELDSGIIRPPGRGHNAAESRFGFSFSVRLMPLRLAFALPARALVGLRLEHTGLVISFAPLSLAWQNQMALMVATRAPFGNVALTWATGAAPSAQQNQHALQNVLRVMAPSPAVSEFHRSIERGDFVEQRYHRFAATQERVLRRMRHGGRALRDLPPLTALFHRRTLLYQLQSAIVLTEAQKQLVRRERRRRQHDVQTRHHPFTRLDPPPATMPNTPTSAAARRSER